MELLLPPKALSITLLVLLLSFPFTFSHNITKILAKHPEFSEFNHFLTTTGLASDINSLQTITVCVVDNSAIPYLFTQGLSINTMKNVLSFHVLLDYFGAKELHHITNGSALAATMFQDTETVTGSLGFVSITDLKGGKVGFGVKDRGKSDAFMLSLLRRSRITFLLFR